MKYLSKLLFIILISILSFCLTHIQNDISNPENINYIQNCYHKIVLITQNSSNCEITAFKSQTNTYSGLLHLKFLPKYISTFFLNSQTVNLITCNVHKTNTYTGEISIRAP